MDNTHLSGVEFAKELQRLQDDIHLSINGLHHSYAIQQIVATELSKSSLNVTADIAARLIAVAYVNGIDDGKNQLKEDISNL